MNGGVKITVLSDKLALPGFEGEHGLSFIVEADKLTLFDTGASDLFIRNAQKLGIDLNSIDTVVLSHGHYDHGNGLQYLNGKRIVTHPCAFTTRYSGRSGRNLTVAIDRETLARNNTIIESQKALWLSERIVYLGEIERTIPFEQQHTPLFHFADGSTDPVIDDSAIAVKTTKGIVVVSGCAHSGICNIVEQARKTCDSDKVYGVIGGFHLTEVNQRLSQTIDYLKKNGTEYALPSHCTSPDVINEFRKNFKGEDVKTGMTIEL